jgi:hypothetical protein
MGYIKPVDLAFVLSQIRMAGHESSDQRTDSWIAWGIKQDLYHVLWATQRALRQSAVFSLEEEWLKEQEKNQLVDILNR